MACPPGPAAAHVAAPEDVHCVPVDNCRVAADQRGKSPPAITGFECPGGEVEFKHVVQNLGPIEPTEHDHAVVVRHSRVAGPGGRQNGARGGDDLPPAVGPQIECPHVVH